MTLNDLLSDAKIDPREVIAMRHQPYEPELKKVMPWIAAEHPDLFNAYQQHQGPKLEKAMSAIKFVASFLAYGPGKAIFVGLYSVKGFRPVTYKQFWELPENIKLKSYGMAGLEQNDPRPTIKSFHLKLEPPYSSWKGKLIINWPGRELSWWRRAEKNDFSVLAILEECAFAKAMPKWDDISWSWDELGIMPRSWQEKLSQWRGIYYIFDEAACRGYIGSACGTENILGRWKNYAATGHGGNRLLRERDPKNFRFSILELVALNMPKEELVSRENSWKERLRTRHPFGLNNN